MPFHWGVMLVGVVFFLAGVLLIVKYRKNGKNNTMSAMAEVVRYHEEIHHSAGSTGESLVYFPVLRYYASGKWCENKYDVGRGKQKYAIGERVEILYDPEHPDSFHITGDKSDLLMGIIAVLIGIGVCILSFHAK